MASTKTSPVMRTDRDNAATYHQVSAAAVAYSVPLSDLVIADYDASGAVRGLEFIGKRTMPLAAYLAKARDSSRGPKREPREPIPAAARGA